MKIRILAAVLVASAGASAATVDLWGYPLSSWKITREKGVWVDDWDGNGKSGYHLGQDVSATAGTSVKNSRWGIVRFAGPKSGYGYVVIIESPRDAVAPTSDPATWKNVRVQVYGHLRNDTAMAATKAKIGKAISKGATIGTIGSKSENGGFNPHLHYGVKLGRYTDTWTYWGYSSSATVNAEWLKGNLVIDAY